MLLGDLLHREVISSSLKATEKVQAIQELIDLLADSGDLPSSLLPITHQAILAREETMATGMEKGIALPHGSIEGLGKVVCALGLSKSGIDFGCLDGELAYCIVLLVLPREDFQVHVRTLAGISHLLNEEPFRTALIAAEDIDAILSLINEEEQGVSFFSRFKRHRQKT